MNLTFITRAVGAVNLAVKAHAPTLMVTGGVVSMGAAVVTASRKTLDLEEILAPAVAALETVEEATGKTGYVGGEFTPEKARGARYKIYTKAGFELCKHYAVPGVLFIGGAGLVFGGHHIMVKRNAAMAVAFTTLQRALEKYRHSAREAMGPEFDRGMMEGYTNKEVIDDKSGAVETISTMDWESDFHDPYNRVFEQGESTLWQPDLGINKDFLDVQRSYAQQLLNRRGYLYLSEVYNSLGFDESPISRLVGWRVKQLPDGTKNIPVVDFGLDRPIQDDWKYNREQAIYLDFNCQGMIIGGKVQKLLEKA